jgi:hypothetical protein
MDNSIINNTKTQPIAIINPLQQYTLKHGLFDPIQNSPPSVWKNRLMLRLNNTVVTQPFNNLLGKGWAKTRD